MRVATTPMPPSAASPRGTPTLGILSTYPPTACGLATFSAALAGGLSANGAEVRVVRVGDGSPALTPPVVAELVNGSPTSVAAATEVLDRCDVAVVQHEYGVYGGTDGDEVLEILGGLRIPSIVIVHTIVSDPTPHQRAVLVAVAEAAGRVVVMSDAARARLCTRFDVDPTKVTTIPHGATVPTPRAAGRRSGPPTMLTWGLIGPGKGIERVVDVLPTLHDLGCRAHYLVAGQTHPKVLAKDGESYRFARMAQARRNGVAAAVSFDDGYRDVATLTALIQSVDVVVLPYDSAEQVTSGVLVDAIAAGRPVVATAFPHAVELLGTGAGIVVGHDDPEALTTALHRVLTEPGLGAAMAAEATRLAPRMDWAVVARRYLDAAGVLLAERLVAGQPELV